MGADSQAPADPCKGSTSRLPAVKYPKGPAYRRTQLCRGRHTGEPNSVGAGLLAKALCLAITMVDVPASSRASALLQRIRRTPITCGDQDSVGAGLLATALCLAMTMADVPASSRASVLLQRIRRTYHLRRPRFRRSRLAGEGVVSGDDDGGCAGVFAGKRAPTWDQHPDLLRQTTSVGAGLLAKALCLTIMIVNVPASSRASAPLQGIYTPITCGDHDSVVADLLAKALCLAITMVDVPASSRASALLHGISTPICCGKPHP